MIGKTISHYKILEELGEGGMGVVYKAMDLRLQRKVALKLLPIPIGGLSKSERERFLLEARATSSLDHPNICTVYEVDETPEGHALIAMALYDGETLAQRIKRGALDHEEVVRVASQIGLGLQAAHEQGIVHRDIKSSNIMLTKTGQVKIMDFGVAKYVAGDGITQSGMRIGTLAYMSPEQAQGKVVDQRAAIWSFGIVLHEMISGTLPFDASYEFGLLYAIIHDRPSVLSQREPAVHPEFQAIVDKCLEKDPQRRFSTAGQVVDHLLSVGPLPLPASSITAVKRIVRRGIRFVRIQWVATMLTACFVITGIVLLLILRSAEIQSDAITYEINQVSGAEQSSGVKKEVLEYLLLDELEQSSYEKILTRIQFSKTYPGKIPATEVTFNVRAHLLNTEIEVRMQRASTFPMIGGATYDTTYQFGDPSMLLKGYTADIADKVLRFAGVAQKRISTFTPSWVAFESFYEGEEAWKKLETNTARQLYQKALRIDSNFVLARLRFADALRFEGAYAEAQVNVRMIEPHLGMLSIVDSLRARALIALLRGETWKHVELLHEVLNYKPYAVESQYFLAEAYYQISDINHAKVYYLKALDIDPDYALAHNHLAYCYTYLGVHDSALVHFQKYVRLDSTANSYDSYGDGLFAAGFLDSAAWAKERGISLNRKMTFLPKTLFYIRSFQGQLKKAETSIVHFRGIAFTDDLRAQAEFFEGFVNYLMKRDTDALRHCLKALKIFDIKNVVSRNHDLHWLLGLIYLRLGQVDAATRELNEMEELVRDNEIDEDNYRIYLFKSMLHLRACIAARRGDIQGLNKFAEELDGALKTKVKDLGSPFDLSFFYTALGELYLEPAVNRPQDAEEYFNKSLLYNHRFPFAHHQLWRLYQRESKLEKAEYHHRELQKIWKDADPEWKAIYFSQKTKK